MLNEMQKSINNVLEKNNSTSRLVLGFYKFYINCTEISYWYVSEHIAPKTEYKSLFNQSYSNSCIVTINILLIFIFWRFSFKIIVIHLVSHTVMMNISWYSMYYYVIVIHNYY